MRTISFTLRRGSERRSLAEADRVQNMLAASVPRTQGPQTLSDVDGGPRRARLVPGLRRAPDTAAERPAGRPGCHGLELVSRLGRMLGSAVHHEGTTFGAVPFRQTAPS